MSYNYIQNNTYSELHEIKQALNMSKNSYAVNRIHELIQKEIYLEEAEREGFKLIDKYERLCNKYNELVKKIDRDKKDVDILMPEWFLKKLLNCANYSVLLQQLNCDKCPICLDAIKKEHCAITKCGHVFHKECIKKFLVSTNTNKCPVCRQ